MRKIIFLIKTVGICILFMTSIYMLCTLSFLPPHNSSYVRVVDPYQSQADLQQTKNILHNYLELSPSTPIGVILQLDKPLFLVPPTYDTGTLDTYIQSIQSQDSESRGGDIHFLVQDRDLDHVFTNSTDTQYKDFSYFEPKENATITEDVSKQNKTKTRQLGLLGILIIVMLLI